MLTQQTHSALGLLALTATLTIFLALPGATLASDDASPAGSVKTLSGAAHVHRGGAQATVLKPGDRIFEKDVLTTGKDGSLGLVMRDNSLVSLGPGSRLVVERFLFAPEKGALASILRVGIGSSAFLTGEIAKLSPGAMQVMTPTSSIGIRGTHFLVYVDDAQAEEGGR